MIYINDDTLSMVSYTTAIYTLIMIISVILISKMYESYWVLGIKNKQIKSKKGYKSFVRSYFEFQNANGKPIECSTLMYKNVEKGKQKKFLYNEDRNCIVSSESTFILCCLPICSLLVYTLSKSFVLFAIGFILVMSSFYAYGQVYEIKYKNNMKRKNKNEMKEKEKQCWLTLLLKFLLLVLVSWIYILIFLGS